MISKSGGQGVENQSRGRGEGLNSSLQEPVGTVYGNGFLQCFQKIKIEHVAERGHIPKAKQP